MSAEANTPERMKQHVSKCFTRSPTKAVDAKQVSTYYLGMGRARRTSSDRRLELVDAALQIIATQGIASLNTRSLATHVGLSSGAIFKHFASIEALLDAVVARVEAVLDATYPPASLPPVERLRTFVEARSTAVGNQLGILRLVVSEQFRLALPQGASTRLAGCVQKTLAFALDGVREGQRTGELRSDLGAETLALLVMAVVQMLAVSPLEPPLRDAEARAVLDSLIVFLRSPASAPPSSRRNST